MNNIIIMLKSIKASVKESPVVYAIFVLFYVFSVIGGIYVLGKYSSNILAYDIYDKSLSTFFLDFRLGSKTRLLDISDSLDKLSPDDNVAYIRLRFLDSDFDDETVQFHYAICYPKNEKSMVTDYFKKYGIRSVDADEFINSENSIIAIIDSTNEPHTDSLSIWGKDFKILQTVYRGKNDALYHLISYKSALELNPVIRELEVNYKSISGYNQLNEINDSLMRYFPNTEINAPVVRDYSVEGIFTAENILVCLVLALSVVNFIYIFQYIAEKRKKQYNVLYLCGCSHGKIIAFTAAEILIMSVICSGIGIFIFHFAIRPIIISLEPLLTYSFYLGMYMTVFGIAVIVGCGVLAAVAILRKRGARK